MHTKLAYGLLKGVAILWSQIKANKDGLHNALFKPELSFYGFATQTIQVLTLLPGDTLRSVRVNICTLKYDHDRGTKRVLLHPIIIFF